MTTRFPHLPVLGHVPKKRKPDLTKTITLAQLYAILEDDGIYDLFGTEQIDYALQRIREEAKKIAVTPRG